MAGFAGRFFWIVGLLLFSSRVAEDGQASSDSTAGCVNREYWLENNQSCPSACPYAATCVVRERQAATGRRLSSSHSFTQCVRGQDCSMLFLGGTPGWNESATNQECNNCAIIGCSRCASDTTCAECDSDAFDLYPDGSCHWRYWVPFVALIGIFVLLVAWIALEFLFARFCLAPVNDIGEKARSRLPCCFDFVHECLDRCCPNRRYPYASVLSNDRLPRKYPFCSLNVHATNIFGPGLILFFNFFGLVFAVAVWLTVISMLFHNHGDYLDKNLTEPCDNIVLSDGKVTIAPDSAFATENFAGAFWIGLAYFGAVIITMAFFIFQRCWWERLKTRYDEDSADQHAGLYKPLHIFTIEASGFPPSATDTKALISWWEDAVVKVAKEFGEDSDDYEDDESRLSVDQSEFVESFRNSVAEVSVAYDLSPEVNGSSQKEPDDTSSFAMCSSKFQAFDKAQTLITRYVQMYKKECRTAEDVLSKGGEDDGMEDIEEKLRPWRRLVWVEFLSHALYGTDWRSSCSDTIIRKGWNASLWPANAKENEDSLDRETEEFLKGLHGSGNMIVAFKSQKSVHMLKRYLKRTAGRLPLSYPDPQHSVIGIGSLVRVRCFDESTDLYSWYDGVVTSISGDEYDVAISKLQRYVSPGIFKKLWDCSRCLVQCGCCRETVTVTAEEDIMLASQVITVCSNYSDPAEVMWAHFGLLHTWKEVCRRQFGTCAIISGAMLLWSVFYMPWAVFSLKFAYEDSNVSFLFESLLGLMIAVGNCMLATVCEVLSFWYGFTHTYVRQSFYLKLAVAAIGLNVMIDLLAVYLTVRQGEFERYASLSDNKLFAWNYGIDQLFDGLYSVLIPAYVLVPYIGEPIMTLCIMPLIAKLRILGDKSISKEQAELMLAPPDIDVVNPPYGDMICTTAVFCLTLIAPNQDHWRLFCWMIVWVIFLYCQNRWRILRCHSQTDFPNLSLHTVECYLWSIPLGILAGCYGSLQVADQTNVTSRIQWWYTYAIIHVFFHCLFVYVLMETEIIVSESEDECEREYDEQKDVSHDKKVTYNSTNPVEALKATLSARINYSTSSHAFKTLSARTEILETDLKNALRFFLHLDEDKKADVERWWTEDTKECCLYASRAEDEEERESDGL